MMDIEKFIDKLMLREGIPNDILTYSHTYTLDKKHIYELALKAKEINAKNILEIGSCFGISTAGIAYACPDANVYSVDLCKELTNSYRENYWQSLGLTNLTAIQDFGLNYMIFCRNTNKTFDFVFHDADHGDKIIPEYLFGYELVNKGGYFACHDWDQITMKEAMIEYWHPSQITVTKDDKNRELFTARK